MQWTIAASDTNMSSHIQCISAVHSLFCTKLQSTSKCLRLGIKKAVAIQHLRSAAGRHSNCRATWLSKHNCQFAIGSRGRLPRKLHRHIQQIWIRSSILFIWQIAKCEDQNEVRRDTIARVASRSPNDMSTALQKNKKNTRAQVAACLAVTHTRMQIALMWGSVLMSAVNYLYKNMIFTNRFEKLHSRNTTVWYHCSSTTSSVFQHLFFHQLRNLHLAMQCT